MYSHLFTRLALNSTYDAEFSQPVSMQGANATQFDFVIFSLSGTTPTVTVTIQESNDLENWRDRTGTGSSSSSAAVGYTLSAATGNTVAAGYVRAKVALTGSTPIAVVSVGLNTTTL